MVSGCTADDADIPFEGISCGTGAMNDESTRLELSDCNIELMDQFQLTDQIDLCNDEVILSDSDLFQGTSIIMPDLSDTIVDDLIVAQNQNHPQVVMPVAPAQVVENTAVAIATKKPKKVIVAQSTGSLATAAAASNGIQPVDRGPSLEYVVWLDHVIECINMSIDYNSKDPNVTLSFNVHEVSYDRLPPSVISIRETSKVLALRNLLEEDIISFMKEYRVENIFKYNVCGIFLRSCVPLRLSGHKSRLRAIV